MTTSGELHAWHFGWRKPVRLTWTDGRITGLKTVSSPPAQDQWIAPTLFDLQINGYGGVDFQQDDLPAEKLLAAARGLRAAGCGRFLLTLITDDWPRLMERLRHFRSLRTRSSELQASIAGWHIEGPFLSAEPGFAGAHDPAWMRDATPDQILELRATAGDDPVLLTVAPERPGALHAIELATAQGMAVSLGHTDASTDVLRQSVEAGARGFTHLGNGCPRALDRHDNILWRVFETTGLTVSLIPDQIHVSPPLFRLAHRLLPPDSIYYTSDAMSAAGAPPGRYRIGKLELDVGADQIVRQPGKPLFAGSALRPCEGVVRAAQMLGCPWQEAWRRFSEVPAKFMGMQHNLAIGQPASFCLIALDDQNQFSQVQTWMEGAPMN